MAERLPLCVLWKMDSSVRLIWWLFLSPGPISLSLGPLAAHPSLLLVLVLSPFPLLPGTHGLKLPCYPASHRTDSSQSVGPTRGLGQHHLEGRQSDGAAQEALS